MLVLKPLIEEKEVPDFICFRTWEVFAKTWAFDFLFTWMGEVSEAAFRFPPAKNVHLHP